MNLPEEYLELERESSDLLLEADSRQVLGRYPEAALATRRAGAMRERMGLLRQEAGDDPGAMADWLSSAACYIRSAAGNEAAAVLERVRQLLQAGAVPADRADLRTALRERERELSELTGSCQNGHRTFAEGVTPA